jgi:hypothetical protein
MFNWLAKLAGATWLGNIFKLAGIATEGLKVDHTAKVANKYADQSSREAPNAAEVTSRNNINFEGQINVAGLPQGSSMTSKTTGAKPINMEWLGQN